MSYVSNVSFFKLIFIMAGAMIEIRDDGSFWSVNVLLLCVCVIFVLLFVHSIFSFLYALYGHLVSDVCYKMAIVEEFNQE